MALDPSSFLGKAGLSLNENGGVYKNGSPASYAAKAAIAIEYEKLKTTHSSVSSRKLAAAARCSQGLARKIMLEVDSGGIIDPATKKKNYARGIGARTFTLEDEHILLALRAADPSCNLGRYQRGLFQRTGTLASKSLISSCFLHAHHYKGSLRKGSFVPKDKFKPENHLRLLEYLAEIRLFDPRMIKFGDEKHLKGAEIFNRKVRRDPITGAVDGIPVDPDFRNTYTIMGLCGIDPSVAPMHYYLHDGTNDSAFFSAFVENAVGIGWLRPYNVLVLDNASIHKYGDSADLGEWLWDSFCILVVFLPPRSPELNPIELLWGTLVQRLATYDLDGPRPTQDACAVAALQIMSGFTHDLVASCYRHCKYIA